MMGMNTANQKQIKLIKAYMQNETGLPYDRISEEEKNPTASFLGWIVAVLRFFAFDADSLLLPGYAFFISFVRIKLRSALGSDALSVSNS